MLKTACGNGFPLNIPSEIPTGGGGGTGDYPDLTNKPKINDVTLLGEMTAADLGLASADIEDLIPSEASSTNKLVTADDIPDAVIGNPSGSATAGNLTKLQIGDDIYNVPSGGSNAYGVYSGSETEVGTWNNARLYRKVVTIGYLPTTGTKTMSDELPAGAVVRHIWGTCFTSPQDPPSGHTLTLPLIPFSDLTDAITIGVSGRDVYVTVGKDRSSMYGYIVIEYTKAA